MTRIQYTYIGGAGYGWIVLRMVSLSYRQNHVTKEKMFSHDVELNNKCILHYILHILLNRFTLHNNVCLLKSAFAPFGLAWSNMSSYANRHHIRSN